MTVSELNYDIYVITSTDDVVYVTTLPNNYGQSAIQFQDEGINLGTPGKVSTINFVGAGVVASLINTILTITITSSGGGGTWGSITGTLASQTDLQTALDLKATSASVTTEASTRASADTTLQTNINLKMDELFTTYTKTNDYTLLAADLTDINAGKRLMFEMNKATALTLTIPLNSAVAFPVGVPIWIRRIGVGVLTIAGSGGVTITGSSGGLTDAGLNVDMFIVKTGTDTWLLQNGSPGTWSDWVPTWTGFSADPSAVTARYFLDGKKCTVTLTGTNGTSNATTTTVTLPFAARSGSVQVFMSFTVDGGVNQVGGWVRTRSNSNILDCYKTPGTLTWTNSGAKMCYFSFVYEIA